MPGGLLQLAAYGPQDVYLTGNPQITFFIAVYKRHTNFAIESIQQLFHGDINFGQTIYCNISPNADLVHEMFLNIKLPNLNVNPEKNPDYTVSWVNAIGHAIIRHIDVEIGGTLIDRQFGQWMEVWSELTLTAELTAKNIFEDLCKNCKDSTKSFGIIPQCKRCRLIKMFKKYGVGK